MKKLRIPIHISYCENMNSTNAYFMNTATKVQPVFHIHEKHCWKYSSYSSSGKCKFSLSHCVTFYKGRKVKAFLSMTVRSSSLSYLGNPAFFLFILLR